MPLALKRERPGERLRAMRTRLGLTTRDVAARSRIIAADQGSVEFSISHARLVQIENEKSAPSVYKLFTLSAIYGQQMSDLFHLYMDVAAASRLHMSMQLPNTHLSSLEHQSKGPVIPFPIHYHSGPPMEQADLLTRLVQNWGEVPAPLVQRGGARVRYGVIGFSDFTMYPLLRPGSFVQIEECEKPARAARYQTEYDRPIYFIELRTGYLCSWCEMDAGRILSVPHPLSPCRTRQFAHPSEAEIIGRVTAVAVKLVQPTPMSRLADADPGARRRDGTHGQQDRRALACAPAGL